MSQAEIIGLVRFSVVTAKNLASWRATRGVGVEEAVARIFDDRRLETRFRLFDLTCLAGFRHEHAAGARFRLLVLVSPLMPAAWRARLDALVADAPFVELVDVPFDSSVQYAIKRHVRATVAEDATVLTFRIDDDDCLCAGMIGRLRAHATPENAGKVVSFVNGVYCSVADERLTVVDKVYRSNAFGIAHVADAGDFRSIFSLGSHTKLEEDYPFVADAHPRAWLRSMHGAADTGGRHDMAAALTGGQAEAALADAFPYLDAPALRDAYLRAAPVAA